MCEKMLLTDIMARRYNVSSLKNFLFGDVPIDKELYEDFVLFLPDAGITQVYCMYIFVITAVINDQCRRATKKISEILELFQVTHQQV